MASIQSAINSMIGSASHAILAVKGYRTIQERERKREAREAEREVKKQNFSGNSLQMLAADKAKQSVLDAVTAKTMQRENFYEHLKKRPDIPEPEETEDLLADLRKKIAQQRMSVKDKKVADVLRKEN